MTCVYVCKYVYECILYVCITGVYGMHMYVSASSYLNCFCVCVCVCVCVCMWCVFASDFMFKPFGELYPFSWRIQDHFLLFEELEPHHCLWESIFPPRNLNLADLPSNECPHKHMYRSHTTNRHRNTCTAFKYTLGGVATKTNARTQSEIWTFS